MPNAHRGIEIHFHLVASDSRSIFLLLLYLLVI